jgi:Asp-tRNA(Asn)/Glu-tRNA(Gln) amidotransferase A subunit family amidase
MVIEMSGRELVGLLHSGEVSPREVVAAFISRIEAVDPAINAIAGRAFQRAEEEAILAERALVSGDSVGPLTGLPFLAKDMEDAEGVRTTYGSPLFRDHVPTRDSAVVAQVRRAGGILLAKTNVPEFSNGANTRNAVFGATGNPYNPDLIAGGSSGGSAAALAADMAPLATGSDTGGSIRIPAAFCGVYGIRTSPGFVPNGRQLLPWSPISVVGPMGRSVDDLRLGLSVMMAQSPADPLSFPSATPTARARDLSQLRIGFTEDFDVCAVDADQRALFRERIALLSSMVASCEPVSFAEAGSAAEAFEVFRSEIYLAGEIRRGENSQGKHGRASAQLGNSMMLRDGVRARLLQADWYSDFQRVFSEFDAILAPVVPVAAFPWRQDYPDLVDGRPQAKNYDWLELCSTVSLIGNPVVAIPAGLDEQGMPVGLQVIGRTRGEWDVLDVAEAIDGGLRSNPLYATPRPGVERLPARRDLREFAEELR